MQRRAQLKAVQQAEIREGVLLNRPPHTAALHCEHEHTGILHDVYGILFDSCLLPSRAKCPKRHVIATLHKILVVQVQGRG